MFFLCGILVKAKVKQLREETAPVIARFMEAEVLRSQIQAQNVELLNGGREGWGLAAGFPQVCSEDLVRLKQEVVACKEELKEGISECEFLGGILVILQWNLVTFCKW